jgi:hypothetical protein
MHATEYPRLQWALDRVKSLCADHFPEVKSVWVRGSAADGTGLPGCDLDVDLVMRLRTTREQMIALAKKMRGFVTVSGIRTRGFQICVETPGAETSTWVDIMPKWVRVHAKSLDSVDPVDPGDLVDLEHETLLHPISIYCVGPDGKCVHQEDVQSGSVMRLRCSPVVAAGPMSQALLVVKRHIQTKRPGVKSCHVAALARRLSSTGNLHQDVRMLWALVVEAGVSGSGLPEWRLEYSCPPYEMHPEYLNDVLGLE